MSGRGEFTSQPPRVVVLTGGSGVGKTTLIQRLSQLGFLTVPEAALFTIEGLNALLDDGHGFGTQIQLAWRTRHAQAFGELVTHVAIHQAAAIHRDYEEGGQACDPVTCSSRTTTIFMDRSVIDSLAYAREGEYAPPEVITPELTRRMAARIFKVFVLQPIASNQKALELRNKMSGRQDPNFERSARISTITHDVYSELGCDVSWLDDMPLDQRVAVLLAECGVTPTLRAPGPLDPIGGLVRRWRDALKPSAPALDFSWLHRMLRPSSAGTAAIAVPRIRASGSGGDSAGAAAPSGDGAGGGPARLRLFHINDVYDLSHYPRVASCIKMQTRELRQASPDATVLTTHGGDFLAPSLLSSLDGGKGHVAALNALSVDVCCFGNHEADVPFDCLVERIHELRATWLNSNMPSLNRDARLKRSSSSSTRGSHGGGSSEPHLAAPRPGEAAAAPVLPPYHVVDLAGGRQVGFVGLVCGGGKYAKLYRSNPDGSGDFGGHAQGIVPPVEAAAAAVARLRAAHPRVDCVVALTHQDVADDEALAHLHFDGATVPVILGGHDHEPMHRVCATHGPAGAVHIVKAGEDAKNVAIVDLIWDATAPRPGPPSRVEVNLQPVPTSAKAVEQATRSRLRLEELQERTGYAVGVEPSRADRLPPVLYPPDRHMQQVVRAVSAPARQVEDMILIDDVAAFARAHASGRPLSSRGPRVGECTMGVLLCTALRRASPSAECAVLNAGNIRADREYSEGALSFADLLAELPFATPFVEVDIDGQTLSDAVACSRASWDPAWVPTTAEERLEVASGKKPGKPLHLDDGMRFDVAVGALTMAAHAPWSPTRTYRVLLSARLLATEANSNIVLRAFSRENAPWLPPEDSGMPPIPLLRHAFATAPDLARSVDFSQLTCPALPAEDVLPRALRSFVPLAATAAGRLAARRLQSLDALDDHTDDPSNPSETGDMPLALACMRQECVDREMLDLVAVVDESAAMLRREIGRRLADEDACLSECQRVVAAAAELSAGVFQRVFEMIASADGMGDVSASIARLQALAAAAEPTQRAWLSARGMPPTAMQCASALHELRIDASRPSVHAGLAWLLAHVQARVPAAESPRGMPLAAAPLKSSIRILEKVLLRPEGEGHGTARICDVLRAMCVVPTMGDFARTLEALSEAHTSQRVVVVRVKDRVTRHDPAAFGMRYALINAYMADDPRRHVFEVQVAHRSIVTAARDLGCHHIYAHVRNAAELCEKLGHPIWAE